MVHLVSGHVAIIEKSSIDDSPSKYKRQKVSENCEFPLSCAQTDRRFNPQAVKDDVVSANGKCGQNVTPHNGNSKNGVFVSVKRTFPEGCGRSAAIINGKPEKDGVVSAIRAFPEGCGRNAARIKAKVKKDGVVFAQRTYPEGCGRNAPLIKSKFNEDDISVDLDEKTKVKVDGAFLEGLSIETPHMRNALISETTVVGSLKSLQIQEPMVVDTPKSVRVMEVMRIQNTRPVGPKPKRDDVTSADIHGHFSVANRKVGTKDALLESPMEQSGSAMELQTAETTGLLKNMNRSELFVSLKNLDGPNSRDFLKSASQFEEKESRSSLVHLPVDSETSSTITEINCFGNFNLDNEKNTEKNIGEEIVRGEATQKMDKVEDEDTLESRIQGNIVITNENGAKAQVIREVFESKLKQGDMKVTIIKSPHENIISQSDLKSPFSSKNFDRQSESFGKKLGKSMKFSHVISSKKEYSRKSAEESCTVSQCENQEYVGLDHSDQRVIVQALAASNCPRNLRKHAFKSRSGRSYAAGKDKGKKHEFVVHDAHQLALLEEDYTKHNKEADCPLPQASENMDLSLIPFGSPPVIDMNVEKEAGATCKEVTKSSCLVEAAHNRDLNLIPFGLHPLLEKDNEEEGGVTRKRVRETLRLFQGTVRKLVQDAESKSKGVQANSHFRADLVSANILKKNNKWLNTGKKILGPVPGVEVGDEFHYRVELAIVGLHHPFQSGIDYLKKEGKVVATSVVASGGYADVMDSSDVLVYSGQGGIPKDKNTKAEDQKLERGNLSLKNSIDEQSPIRVVRGFKEPKDSRGKVVATYTYDGLYTVERFWQETGRYGTKVYKFELRRIPGQPELAIKKVKKSKKSRVREGLCVDDISQGQENIPIGAINTVDDEKPPPFEYVTSRIYPSWYNLTPPKGCECIDGCSDSETCACAMKNGGEIPFNYDGAIVEAKPLVYECGPSCKCPPSCHNKVSQRGISFQLEIFKTESTGWGVRSLNSIPSGSFICEYTGELLEDKEAEERTSNDEYLFDIGNNYNDPALWEGVSKKIHLDPKSSTDGESTEDVGFTIDAAHYGSVGRFINHSCSPNAYAQNVLYDHDDKSKPHIMIFAAENIPPLQEITYHYNYELDQVRDSDGNIKKKNCYCGSPECSGRMY